MSSSSADRLARFRAAKKAEAESEVRRRRAWDTVTMAPVRRTIGGWINGGGGDGGDNQQEQQEPGTADANQEEKEEDYNEDSSSLPWTRLDISILCVKVLLWMSLFYLCVLLELGLAFVLTSGFAAIWLNLGNRKKKDAPSAYSVFNPNCEAIDGTLTADQFEREIRHGAGGMR